MSEEIFRQPLSDELASFEAALRGLAPAPARIERDRLMFRAGRASAEAKPALRWLWPAATAAMTLVSATLAVLLAQRLYHPGAIRAPRDSVAVRHPSPSATNEGSVAVDERVPNELAYFTLRTAVLKHGVDALTDSTLSAQTHRPSEANWLELRRRLIIPSPESTNDPTLPSGEHS